MSVNTFQEALEGWRLSPSDITKVDKADDTGFYISDIFGRSANITVPAPKKKRSKTPEKKKPYFDRDYLKVNDQNYCNIKQVVFNDPATIVLWKDGTKTVVKCKDGDIYDREVGLAMCFMKKIFGNEFHHVMKTYAGPGEVNT